MPVLADFRCQDLIDNDSPAYAGDAGLGKAPHVRALIAEADLILAVGTHLRRDPHRRLHAASASRAWRRG